MSTQPSESLSSFGRAHLAELLAPVRAATVFTAPTIHRCYRSCSLAPDRAIWDRNNRGAMVADLAVPVFRGALALTVKLRIRYHLTGSRE